MSQLERDGHIFICAQNKHIQRANTMRERPEEIMKKTQRSSFPGSTTQRKKKKHIYGKFLNQSREKERENADEIRDMYDVGFEMGNLAAN